MKPRQHNGATNLEPIAPDTAVEYFLEEKDLAPSTLRAYERRLDHFVNWCHSNDIENLNDLTGRDLFEFKTYRKKTGELSKSSLKSQLTAVRSFIKFAERIDGVREDLHRDVVLPSMEPGEDVRDNVVSIEEARTIQEYLERFSYASYRHALFCTAWETHLRTGSLHSLDVDDVLEDEQALRVEHRPETGTRLKNGARANRVIALSEELLDVLADYIDHQRPSVEDEHGREPLFASRHGRMSKSNLRQTCYAVTRPCFYSEECPVGRDIEDCRATAYEHCDQCPDSESLHAVRRGGLTYRLSEDVPLDVISGRANVSRDVLEKHYDARSDLDKMTQRREHLDL